jgi:hypothetical protein
MAEAEDEPSFEVGGGDSETEATANEVLQSGRRRILQADPQWVINRCHAHVRIWRKSDIRSLFLETEGSSAARHLSQPTVWLDSNGHFENHPGHHCEWITSESPLSNMKLCTALAALHEAVLGRPGERFTTLAHSLRLARDAFALVHKRRFGGAAQVLCCRLSITRWTS